MKLKFRLINLKKIELDIGFAILGMLVGIFILLGSVIYGKNYYHFFIVLFFSSLVYILFRKKMLNENNLPVTISNRNLVLLTQIIFFLSISLLIGISYQNLYYRPPVYFLLVLVASTSIVVNIFYFNANKKFNLCLVLFEIIVLAVLIKASLYYDFPGFYEQDPWWHTQWIKETIEIGHITSGNYLANGYYLFPQFHLLIGMTSVVTSLSIHNATFFSVSFIGISIIPALFLFFIAKKFTGLKIALLSTLIFSLLGDLIYRGISIIPMTLGFSLFLIIIYFIFNTSIKKILKNFLLILFSISLNFAHTIAAFITFLSLIALYLSSIIYNKLVNPSKVRLSLNNIISISFVIFFGILMLFIWSINVPFGLSFFEGISYNFINALKESGSLLQPINIIPYYILILEQGAFLIMLFFSFIGSLFYISRKKRDIFKWGMISLPVALYGIVIIFSFYSIGTILPWRWTIFLMIPLSILGMQGLSRVSSIKKKKDRGFFIIGVIVLTIVLLSQIIGPANRDTPFFFTEYSSDRLGWTQSELTGARALYNLSCGRPITDNSYGNIFPYIIGYNEYTEMQSKNNSIFIWRNYYLHHSEWNEMYVTQIHDGLNHIFNIKEKIFVSDYMEKIGIMNQSLIYTNINMKVYIFNTDSKNIISTGYK